MAAASAVSVVVQTRCCTPETNVTLCRLYFLHTHCFHFMCSCFFLAHLFYSGLRPPLRQRRPFPSNQWPHMAKCNVHPQPLLTPLPALHLAQRISCSLCHETFALLVAWDIFSLSPLAIQAAPFWFPWWVSLHLWPLSMRESQGSVFDLFSLSSL